MKDPITDVSSIDKAVAYIITSTARHLKLHLQRSLREHNIGPEQWFLLFRLYEKDGRSQNELADQNANDYPNITRLIDALEKKGFAERQVDVTDRRRQLVYLTEHGRNFMKDLMPWVIEVRKEVYNGISKDELFQLVATLQKIEENLR